MGGVELDGGSELKVVTGVDDHSRFCADGTIPAALADSKVSTTGVVRGTYKPAGEVVTGSFCPGPTPSLSAANGVLRYARRGCDKGEA